MRHISDVARLPQRKRAHRSRISPEKQEFARQLRKEPTRAFDLLWSCLRSKQLGVKFRRRAPLFGWIPDFWCPSERIVVEIDYPSDAQRQVEHRHRDRALTERGILVLRFPVDRVFSDVKQVAHEIKLHCQRHDA